MRRTEVQRILRQFSPVGTCVEHYGKGACGVHARSRCIDGELADGDVDAPDTPVADA
jgi:hypothetical protein